MGQEHTALSETDQSRIMPSTIGDSNGVSAGLPAQARAQTDALPELTTAELVRYDRHLLLPQVGVEGQRKLKAASVLLIGAGGLGSPLALYLAAAGVGRIGIVDFDVVDESNLQRQILHGTKDIGRPKLQSAKDRLHDLNPYIHIDTYETMLRADNALEICQNYDIIIDGTDNFQTRYLVNDVCVLLGKPNVYGSIFRFEGQASVFHPGAGGPRVHGGLVARPGLPALEVLVTRTVRNLDLQFAGRHAAHALGRRKVVGAAFEDRIDQVLVHRLTPASGVA